MVLLQHLGNYKYVGPPCMILLRLPLHINNINSFLRWNQPIVLHKQRKRRKSWAKYMTRRFKRVKVEMKKISKEQQSIKEGQRQVGAKLKAVQEECEQLRKETHQIIQQTANTRIRLCLMFNILKAREQAHFAKAAHLTRLLREIVDRNNCEIQATMQ